ncbi:MAG: hypothetical protein ACI8SA_001427 [Dokdonia sp.]|jgi:hypothetical protein
MKKALFFALAAFLMIGGGCGSSISITTDYDIDVDFKNYKTFGFLKWNDASAALVNDIDRGRLEKSVTDELQKRGMKRVDGLGDTMIGFHVVVENKTGTTSYTEHYGGMGYYGGGGGFGYGYGYPYGGGGGTTTTSSYSYRVGTVVIDQYDSQTKKLMWEGVAQGEVDGDRSNREENIKKDITKMFVNYPLPIAAL